MTRSRAQATALDPIEGPGNRVARRIAAAAFPVEHLALPATGTLPFKTGQFDCIVTTWTLCSIEFPADALGEMRRVLKPEGRYLFIEHGRSDAPHVAKWQDRLNPVYRRIADGCNMNRPISALVEQAGFEIVGLDRFLGRGPKVLAEMYRGVAVPSGRHTW